MDANSDEFVAGAYETLGLPNGASEEEIERAYASLIHGDNRSPGAWERIKEIERAYETLTKSCGRAPSIRPETAEQSMDQDMQHIQMSSRAASPKTTISRIFALDEKDINPFSVYGRTFLLFIMAFWGVGFIFAPLQGDYIGSSFMHLINLPFHEAGHLIFSFLGDFMRVLGGTLSQILVPFVCVIAFVRRRDPFAASAALWWVGQSFIDVAPYIYDARAGELILLGGVTGQDDPDFHDWHNILGRLDLLPYDHSIAYTSKIIGILLILLSLAGAGYTLALQYRILKKAASRQQ